MDRSLGTLGTLGTRLLLLAMVAAAVGGCSAANEPSQVYEKFTVVFDERPWETVYKDVPPVGAKDQDSMVQYVPEGSTILDWTEMVTERAFPGLQKTSTPEQEMDDARKLAEQVCKRVDWNVVGQEPGSISYVASLGECTESRAPHRIGRFVMSSRAIYLVMYESKEKTLTKQEETGWLGLLERAHYDDVFE